MSDILLSAFLLSVVLLGIHSYFGLEIIRRGIVFADLAIGQMAALGGAVSLLFFDGDYMYPISLFFALGAAFINSIATRRERHPEAFIGLVYALGVSGVFILLSKSPHGVEEFRELLAADILFTPLAKILETAFLYAVLGILLYLVKKRLSGFAGDFFFFGIFAVTVTSSVKLAGVLVVFALLIGPAFIALKLAKRRFVLMAWGAGVIVNVAAIGVSYLADWPTGYTIVLLHALSAIVASLIRPDEQTREQMPSNT